MWSSYGVGQYAADAHVLAAGRNYRPNGTKRLTVFCWGHGNNAAITLDTAYWLGIPQVMATLGLPLASADFASTVHWGNDTAIARLSSLRTYANTNLSPATDKILLIGISMGAILACNWARANTTATAGIALINPALDTTTSAFSTYQTEMNTAYTNNAGWVAARPTHNPAEYAASLSGIPIKVWTANNDTTAPPSQTTSFVSASGATAVDMGATGHFPAAGTAAEVAAFLAPLS